MIQTYEAWQDPRDGSVTFGLATDLAAQRAKGLVSQEARLLYRIDAPTHEEAMAIHHLRMGWEPYRPVGSAQDCSNCGALRYPDGSGQCWQCGATI